MIGLLALVCVCGYATALVFALDYRREHARAELLESLVIALKVANAEKDAAWRAVCDEQFIYMPADALADAPYRQIH